MCPDRDLISAFVDDEVPSPWKERLEEHLAACPDCSAVVAKYRLMGEVLRSSASESREVEAALAQGRNRLDTLLADPQTVRSFGQTAKARRFVSLPLPLAAAAAVLVMLLGGAGALLAFRSSPSSQAAVPAVASSGEIMPVAAKAQPASMDELLRYLDSSDGQITLTINLPSGTTFGSAGKPVIMREAPVIRGRTVSGAPAGEGGVSP